MGEGLKFKKLMEERKIIKIKPDKNLILKEIEATRANV